MKKYKLSLIFLGVFLVSNLLYHIYGSEVLADGTLSEPFYLIGIGGFALIFAGLSAIIITIKNLVKKKD